MLWSRRELLRLFGISAAALVVQRIPWDPSVPAQRTTPFTPRLIEMVGESTNADPGIITIVRPDNGNVVLSCGVGPGGFFRWYAIPGNEIICPTGLVNLSDSNLNVELVFTDGPRIWSVRGDHITFFQS